MSVDKKEWDFEENGVPYKIIYKKLDGEDIWVKKKPKQSAIKPSGVMFIFPDETQHHWELHDNKGHPIGRYYMSGYDGTPSFFISGSATWFKIDADNPEDMRVHIIPLNDVKKIETHVSSNYMNVKSYAPGWFIFLKKKGTDIKVAYLEKMKKN